MNSNGHDFEGMEELEREIGSLFDATAPELDAMQMNRIAARASESKRRNRWMIYASAFGVACAAMVAVLVVGGGKTTSPANAVEEKVEQTHVAQVSSAPRHLQDQVVVRPAEERVSESPSHRRLAPELGELGDGVNAEEVRLAMGTYLDLDLEGDDLDFDNWEGDSEGLSEEELLRATKDLLRNGS